MLGQRVVDHRIAEVGDLEDVGVREFHLTSGGRAFAGDMRSMGRIEWIYHLLVADPERGATELENLNRSWVSVAHEAHFKALSKALELNPHFGMAHFLRLP